MESLDLGKYGEDIKGAAETHLATDRGGASTGLAATGGAGFALVQRSGFLTALWEEEAVRKAT